MFAPLRLDPRVVVLIRGASFQVFYYIVFCLYLKNFLLQEGTFEFERTNSKGKTLHGRN